jgi:PhnB protein
MTAELERHRSVRRRPQEYTMAFFPYLNFDGTCREAFTWYHEIFGGDVTILGSDDVPSSDAPEGFAGRVIHAALMLPDGGLLMASDTQPGGHHTPQGLYVNATVATVEEAEKIWASLSVGAEIEMELAPAFFSPAFGVCTDRFGTPWMLSAADPNQSQG